MYCIVLQSNTLNLFSLDAPISRQTRLLPPSPALHFRPSSSSASPSCLLTCSHRRSLSQISRRRESTDGNLEMEQFTHEVADNLQTSKKRIVSRSKMGSANSQPQTPQSPLIDGMDEAAQPGPSRTVAAEGSATKPLSCSPFDQLKGRRIVLASASPRRREILQSVVGSRSPISSAGDEGEALTRNI